MASLSGRTETLLLGVQPVAGSRYPAMRLKPAVLIPVLFPRNFDEQPAVAAYAPLFDRVDGPHRDALVEAAGGEDVVELIVARRPGLLVKEAAGDDVMRAGAIVPMPFTAISSRYVQPIGLTCLNHSTSTRSDSFTTICTARIVAGT